MPTVKDLRAKAWVDAGAAYHRADEQHDTKGYDPRLEVADEVAEALKAILSVVNVRVDDARCKVFDEARAAIKKWEEFQ